MTSRSRIVRRTLVVLERADVLLTGVSTWVGSALLFLMLVLVAGTTVSRWIVGTSVVADPEELSRYLLMAITYLGAQYAFGSDGFIRIELLFDRFRPSIQRWLTVAAAAISLAVVALLVYEAATYATFVAERGIRSTGRLRTPLVYPYTIVAVGLALTGVQLLLGLLRGVLGGSVILDDAAPLALDEPLADGAAADLSEARSGEVEDAAPGTTPQ